MFGKNMTKSALPMQGIQFTWIATSSFCTPQALPKYAKLRLQ
jgi:hypothetical protein